MTQPPAAPILVRGDLSVHALRDEDLPAVIAALDAAETDADDVPLVDESERERLVGASEQGVSATDGWFPVVAFLGQLPVGYAALLAALPNGDHDDPACGDHGSPATGDVAPLTSDPARAVLGALLAALRHTAAGVGVTHLDVWVRHGGDRDADAARGEGFEVTRRLGVLGRDLGDLPAEVVAADHRIRPYREGEDDDAVVDVLAAAYADTPEAGWDTARFGERRAYSWFRAEDLLLAESESGGRIDGLHWLKRRDATTGEVYNLAVHPRAQGQRLGPALLSAGLHHLAAIGCEDVVLWVDRGNERAVALYEAARFTTRWDDLAFRTEISRER